MLLAVFSLSFLCLFPFEQNYGSPLMWNRYDHDSDAEVDVFMLSSTADRGLDGTWQTSTWTKRDRWLQSTRVGIQAPLYEDNCRIFAPYYCQACLSVYYLEDADRAPYFEISFEDCEAALLYYLEHENNGRPFILAGFSQGADMGLRLLEKYGDTEVFQNQMIAAYLIGWRITDEDLNSYPFLKMAQGEEDIGVIVSFCSEADYVTGSVIVPEGCYTYGINPLNWCTDDTYAPASQNPGSQFYRYTGALYSFHEHVTGCYRDQTRGVIIPTDIDAETYAPTQPVFCEGCYHSYDLSLYFTSVRNNIRTRIDSWFTAHPA